MHISDRTAAWIATRPLVGSSLLGALLIMAVAGIRREAPVDAFQNGEIWRFSAATHAQFDSDGPLGFIALFGPVLENPEQVAGLEGAVEALPWVREVVTPWDLPGAAREADALASLFESPLVRGNLIADDGGGALLPVLTEWGAVEDRPDDWAAALAAHARDSLEGAFLDGTGVPIEVGVTGEGAVLRAQERAFQSERVRFMAFGTLLGFAIASLAFRSVRATCLASFPPLLGVFVATGLARLFGLGADGFASIVLPLLVLTIGFTDSLHIVVASVRAARGGAASGADAATRAVSVLGWPCALTSLTTAIGFASLATSGSALIVDFGLSCALATLTTFVCVIVGLPLLARTPLGSRLETVRPPSAERGGLFGRIVDGGVRASLVRPRVTATCAATATIALALVATGLEADRRAISDLAGSSEAARSLRRTDAELGGVFPIAVRLDWEEGVELEAVLDAAREVRSLVESEPLITGAHGPAEIADALPLGAAGLALAPERWRAPWLDLEGRSALVRARVPDAGSAALLPVFDRVRDGLEGFSHDDVRSRLVGSHIAYHETVADLTRDLRRSLGLAAVLIVVTLAVAFRSWRLGLASVVPNLLPIGASAACLALVDGRVDVTTLTALTLSLGIATDDTIHVLARWRGERAAGAEPREAARAAVARTLPALTLTTMTLTAAFAQLLTSSLATIRDFGLLAGTTLVAAFFADIWLLPSLLVVMARERPESARSERTV